MLLWLENSEMIAALMSLALVPPNVLGPVAGTIPPAKTLGLQRAFCQEFVNGARQSRVGLLGRTTRSGAGASGLRAERPVSALLPVVLLARSHAAGVAASLWRSSNVHGAAIPPGAGKQPTMRRSVPEPAIGGLFLKQEKLGWPAAESRPLAPRSTA